MMMVVISFVVMVIEIAVKTVEGGKSWSHDYCHKYNGPGDDDNQYDDVLSKGGKLFKHWPEGAVTFS